MEFFGILVILVLWILQRGNLMFLVNPMDLMDLKLSVVKSSSIEEISIFGPVQLNTERAFKYNSQLLQQPSIIQFKLAEVPCTRSVENRAKVHRL